MESPNSSVSYFIRSPISPMKRPLFDDENEEPNKVHLSPVRTPVVTCKVLQKLSGIASPVSVETPSRLRFMTPMSKKNKGSYGEVEIFSTPDSTPVAVKTVWVNRLKIKHASAQLPMDFNSNNIDDLENEINSLSMNREGCIKFLGAEFTPTNEPLVQVNLFMEAGTPLEDVLKTSDEEKRKILADEWIAVVKNLNNGETKVSDPKLKNTLIKDGKICLCDVDFRVKPRLTGLYETYEKALKYKRALWIAYQEIVHYGEWNNYENFMRNLREKSMELSAEDLSDF